MRGSFSSFLLHACSLVFGGLVRYRYTLFSCSSFTQNFMALGSLAGGDSLSLD